MSLRHAPWEDAAEFTIGLKPIVPEAWFEGGEADPAARKDALLAAVPHLVWAETEGSRPAQAEALELVSAALGRPIDAAGRPPLLAAAREVSDDLCLMENRDGAWRLTALSLCAGSFFSAHEVIGKSLAELHTPVTGFAERLLARVTRIFDGFRDELVLERRNWSVVSSPQLHMPDPGPMRAAIPEIDPAGAAEALFVRVERQTLRRLPRTGGLVFTIRVWLDPLSKVAQDPQRLAGFARAWRGAAPEFRAYKQLHLYDALVARVIEER
jgi:dimethylamine monooxygenase subunit A